MVPRDVRDPSWPQYTSGHENVPPPPDSLIHGVHRGSRYNSWWLEAALVDRLQTFSLLYLHPYK